VLIVRATKKLRQRLGSATPYDGEPSTTLLGEWYANLLPWRPQQLILLVNEETLVPVLMPLAPGATAARIGPEIAAALAAHQAPAAVIDDELSQMRDCRFGPTANRSVVGIMNDFAYLADVYRHADPSRSLAELGLKLAETPCSPLYRRHVRPDRELEAFLQLAQRPDS
jgi:hypothetical protein